MVLEVCGGRLVGVGGGSVGIVGIINVVVSRRASSNSGRFCTATCFCADKWSRGVGGVRVKVVWFGCGSGCCSGVVGSIIIVIIIVCICAIHLSILSMFFGPVGIAPPSQKVWVRMLQWVGIVCKWWWKHWKVLVGLLQQLMDAAHGGIYWGVKKEIFL